MNTDDDVTKPCVQCENCRVFLGQFVCVGPHVRPDVTTGMPLVRLPLARLTTDPVHLRRGWRYCGEYEANHWKYKEHITVELRPQPYWPSASVWTAGIFVVLAATVGFVYFNGVPLCR